MKISSFFKDTKPLGRLFALFLIFLACSLLASLISVVPGFIKTAEEVDMARLELVTTGFAQMLVFMLPAWIFVRLFTDNPRQALGLYSERQHWALGLVGVAVILLLIPVTDALSLWNGRWQFRPFEEAMRKVAAESQDQMLWLLSPLTVGDLLLQVVVVALVPAICEEVFFRGAVQLTLQSLLRNDHVGILLTAVIFSLAHGDMYGFLPRLLLGLLLGYLFWMTGSIVVSACAHFVNNAVVVVTCHFYNAGAFALNPFEPIGLPWTLTFGCTLGAIGLFYIYFVKNPHLTSRNPNYAPSRREF